ncbi:Uncharacterized protein y4hR [Sphingobium indicum BiD32]|jgi:hypothetical protein|uniref:Uncharacterized protein y4hR n=1 Tax=Sphingobium indicum BiD32 TaxID=1301087 RepID=N1MTE9_9SPHN|nr:DUF6429 family protein [Sphingobium indicum]CCW18947.1 Uncharacterized protein y4hR [Sphingobium indicum BiD32]
MDIDNDRIDATVLALLWLNVESSGTAWKGFDWASMERLQERGLISNPVGKAKSVQLTSDGLDKGARLFRDLFTRSGASLD